ncbi:MAG: hypothetical protein KKE20_04215 [Nanoarchaeota archaeon]|nr:hypothetical protein [Nanoarchaeota archaeon]
MQKPVLCMICGVKSAIRTCGLCGRVVCEEHIDSTGICNACRARKTEQFRQ